MPEDEHQIQNDTSHRNDCCRSTFWTAFFMGTINTVVLGIIGWTIVSLLQTN